jgi:hypothetical protein
MKRCSGQTSLFWKWDAPIRRAGSHGSTADGTPATTEGKPGGFADGSRGLRSAERDDTPGTERIGVASRRDARADSDSAWFWHPFWVRCVGGVFPGVPLRSTPGYLLSVLRTGALTSSNPVSPVLTETHSDPTERPDQLLMFTSMVDLLPMGTRFRSKKIREGILSSRPNQPPPENRLTCTCWPPLVGRARIS